MNSIKKLLFLSLLLVAGTTKTMQDMPYEQLQFDEIDILIKKMSAEFVDFNAFYEITESPKNDNPLQEFADIIDTQKAIDILRDIKKESDSTNFYPEKQTPKFKPLRFRPSFYTTLIKDTLTDTSKNKTPISKLKIHGTRVIMTKPFKCKHFTLYKLTHNRPEKEKCIKARNTKKNTANKIKKIYRSKG